MNFLTTDQKNIYFYFIILAQALVGIAFYWIPVGPEAFPSFFGTMTIQFFLYALAAYLLHFSDPKFKWILLVAIVARLLLLGSSPVLEDDFWRYLWDGRVWADGINPYLFKPMDQALDHLHTDYRVNIGWKQYGTIYPPVSIFIFKIAHIISADSLLTLKFIFILFDLSTGLLVAKFLADLNTPIKWSVLYFLNPLVLKEIANSAHLDAIAVFFTLLAVVLLHSYIKFSRHPLVSYMAWFFLAVAFASKLYSVCLVPVFFKLDKKRWPALSLFPAAALFLYLPMISAGRYALNGTEAFARHWIYNASLYRIFQKAFHFLQSILENLAIHDFTAPFMQDSFAAKALSVFAFTSFVFYRVFKKLTPKNIHKEILYILGALLLFSPVVNAWYVLWLAPFACVSLNFTWILFTYLVITSYSWWYSQEMALYLRWLEYLVLFLLLLFQWIKSKYSEKERL